MRRIVATGELFKADAVFAPEAPTAEQLASASALDAMLGPPKKERKPRGAPRSLSPSAAKRAADEAQAMMASGEWSPAEPRHFVALYSALHLKVYGVPSEAMGKEGTAAAGAAKRLLDREFNGDKALFVEYVRWSFQKEHRTEQWRRRENPGSTFRLGWRLLFSLRGVTEWRIALARRKE